VKPRQEIRGPANFLQAVPKNSGPRQRIRRPAEGSRAAEKEFATLPTFDRRRERSHGRPKEFGAAEKLRRAPRRNSSPCERIRRLAQERRGCHGNLGALHKDGVPRQGLWRRAKEFRARARLGGARNVLACWRAAFRGGGEGREGSRKVGRAWESLAGALRRQRCRGKPGRRGPPRGPKAPRRREAPDWERRHPCRPGGWWGVYRRERSRWTGFAVQWSKRNRCGRSPMETASLCRVRQGSGKPSLRGARGRGGGLAGPFSCGLNLHRAPARTLPRFRSTWFYPTSSRSTVEDFGSSGDLRAVCSGRMSDRP
jgi:hypothetical protein